MNHKSKGLRLPSSEKTVQVDEQQNYSKLSQHKPDIGKHEISVIHKVKLSKFHNHKKNKYNKILRQQSES